MNNADGIPISGPSAARWATFIFHGQARAFRAPRIGRVICLSNDRVGLVKVRR
jgi:hypothetical protein